MIPFPARFEPVRQLGEGASGVVYEARDRTLGVAVAVKVLRDTTPKSVTRLKYESRAFADIAHDNLVDVHGLYEHDGHWFMAMELVDGIDLAAFCRQTNAGSALALESASRTASRSRFTSEADFDDGPIDPSEPPARMPALDYDRIRAVFGELLEGVRALHGAGIVHRDLKPSNVLVETSGRVVVLDLGLAVALGDSERGAFAGTRAYAAPEQLFGEAVDERCDVYAVGVMLYEVLTGRLPHRPDEGGSLAARKRQWDPPAIEGIAPTAPPDLCALCRDMLERDVGRRPRVDALLARSPNAFARARASEPRRATTTTFVGREDSLEALDAALRRARAGHPTTVLVSGRSGIGKTALLRRFLDGMARNAALVLEGRCYAHERVAFRGIDAIVDGLGRWLRKNGGVAAETAARLGELGRMFPSLAFAGREERNDDRDDRVRRTRAFDEFAHLLAAVAKERTIVVSLDDAQWLDDDGFELLRAVFGREHGAPLLLLVGTRTDAQVDPDKVTRVRDIFPTAKELVLGPLPEPACLDLARHLTRFDPSDSARLARIAADSGGDPFLVRELLASPAVAADPTDLEHVLRRRVGALSTAPRELLTILALAGRPLGRDDLFEASGLAPDDATTALRSLRVARLVRTAERAGRDGVDVFHDRIRDVAISFAEEPAIRERHRRLAAVLERTTDPAVQGDRIRHLLEGGDPESAARLAKDAAARAFEVLAFDRAVDLLLIAARAESDRASEELARALVAAGRGGEAADVFLQLAEVTNGEERGRHLQRAAEQLLTSGDLDRGLSTLARVLDDVGETLPKSRFGALAGVVFQKFLARVTKVATTPVDDEGLRRRFDALRTVAFGLGMVDNLSAALCHSKAFVVAQRLGDPRALGEVIATEAIFRGSTGTRARREAGRLVDEARAIGERAQDESVAAWAEAADAALGVLGSISKESIDRLERAEDGFNGGMTSARWAKSSLYLMRALSVRLGGDLRRVARIVDAGIRDARERRDRYLEVTLLRGGVIVHLADDSPERARENLGLARWTPPIQGFHIQHWLEIEAVSELALYEGRGAEALDAQRPALEAMRRSLLGRLQRVRVLSDGLVGRLVLARAERGWDRGMSRQIAKIASRLDGEDVGYARVQAALLRAGASHVTKDATTETLHLERAIAAADACGLRAVAAAARFRLAKARPKEAASLERAADLFFVEQGIRRPGRLVDVYAPGWPRVCSE